MIVKAKKHVLAQANPDGTLELLVYEDIGQNWDGTGLTAKSIKQAIDAAGVYSKISVRINSPGGDAFEGLAIHNLLRAQKKPIEVCVDGIAASSASIIAMAGDKITMGHSAMMMIHSAWSMCVGNADDMRKMADTLDKVSASIGQTYADKTGKSMDEVKALMDAETWLSADDCVANGLATGIAEDPEEEGEAAMAKARRFKALARMKNVPVQLKTKPKAADSCECTCSECESGDCSGCDNPDCTDANCLDCPMQADTENSNLTQYEARLSLLGKH
jgi:ATP-dependent protease ClpP protease subunit